MTPLKQKMVSGRAIKLTAALPIPTDERVSIVLLGNGSGFLGRILAAHVIKPIHTRTVVAPRIVQTPGRSKRLPSFGSAEAIQARKDGLVHTVVTDAKRVSDNGEVIDITPMAEFAKTTLWQIAAAQRHELVVETLRAWIPTPPDGGEQITIVELPPVYNGTRMTQRLSSLSKLETPIDHLLWELLEGTPERVIGYNTENLFFISADERRIMRLDCNDKKTTGRQRLISVLATAEKLYSGEKLEANEAEDIGGSEVVDIPATPVVPVIPAAERRRNERIIQLREEQSKVEFPKRGNVGTINIGHVMTHGTAATPLAVRKASGQFIDKRVAIPRFDSISRSYVQQNFDSDMASVFASLSNDPLTPHFVQKIERKNSSDSLNYKETLSVQYKDKEGRSTTIHVDIPIIDRDDYMTLNGNKYNITKQILALPIIKVRPDEVLITTAYNKATVERFGQNASAMASYIRLLAATIEKTKPVGVKIDFAPATAANAKFRSAVEYDDIAKTVRAVRTKNSAFIFSRPASAKELASSTPWALDKLDATFGVGGVAFGQIEGGSAVVGLTANGELRILRKDRVEVPGDDVDLAAVMYKAIMADSPQSYLPAPSVPQRKYMYSRAKMLSQYLPTAVIVGYDVGLVPMLNRAEIPFKIVDATAYRRSKHDGSDAVQFEDAVVVFSPRRLRDSLLVNGLKELDTDERPMSDFGPAGLGWVDHIADRLGGPGHAKALVNYQTSFIDPMTRDLLKSYNLPTDMAGVLLYASAMLESNEHPESNDMASYRMRGPELVNTILYKVLHKEMERVRATRESASPQKLLVNPAEVIRAIQSASNVEEVSELNPLLEAELRGKATWTGASGGLSDGRTVNRAMRAYHKSMHGIFGFYSPDSAEIGVKRTLSFGASIKDTRGRFDLELAEKDAAQVLALGELITPFVAQHADPPRIGMQSKQATHTMPITKHTPLLVGSGAEKALAHAIGNTYAYKSLTSGKITKIDEKTQLVQLTYDNGEIAYIDMSPRSVKNSGGGFYITAQLKLNPGYKLGSKFDEGVVLAHDDSYFSPMADGSTAFKSGLLVRIAIAPLDQTYEDSLMITDKLAQDTTSKVTLSRSVNFGAKTNLQSIAKVGAVVGPNDSLAVFENVTDDADISAMLQRVGVEFDDAIAELTKNTAPAKYSGKIVEMRTYYNKELDVLSPSLQKFIKSQERAADERRKAAADAPIDAPIRVNAPIKITRDKVAGEIVDGVLAVFLIQVESTPAPGDKLVCASPLKGIISRVFEPGEEPYDETGNQIDYITSPLSIVSRMTNDAFLTLWSAAVLVDLKKEVLSIYKS